MLVIKRWGAAGMATAIVGCGLVVPAAATAVSTGVEPASIAASVELTSASDWLANFLDPRSADGLVGLSLYELWSHDGLLWGGFLDPWISSGTLLGEVLWSLQGNTAQLDALLAGDWVLRGPSMWIPMPGGDTIVDPMGWLAPYIDALSELLHLDFSGAFNTVVDAISSDFTDTVTFFDTLGSDLMGAFDHLFSGVAADLDLGQFIPLG